MVKFKELVEAPDKDWPKLLPRTLQYTNGQIKNLSLGWKFGSAIVVPTVALISKFWTDWMNKTKIYNHQVYLDCLDHNYKTRENALITICNHHSCMDDPLILSALLPWTWNFNSVRHRFAGAAHNICFTNQLHSLFFSLGKSIPIYRGAGIYQPSVNFLLDLITANQFVHVFPQGKVIDENYQSEIERIMSDSNFTYKQLDLRDKEDHHLSYSFKWGLARLILDSLNSNHKKIIELLPFYHVGMDKVLPNTKPYIPKTNKQITILVRENGPLRFSYDFINELCKGLSSTSDKRRQIMNYLEDEMKKLKMEALKRHLQAIEQK